MCFRKSKYDIIAAIIILVLCLGVIPCLGGRDSGSDLARLETMLDEIDNISQTPFTSYIIRYFFFEHVGEAARPIGIIPGPFDDLDLKKTGRDPQTQDLAILFDAGFIHINLGNTDGKFYFQDSIFIDTGTIDMDVGDFDRDGDLDILVIDEGNKKIKKLLNDGSANFNVVDLKDLTSAPHAIDIIDLNRDGNLDIILAMDSSIRIYYGDGTGDIVPTGTVFMLGYSPTAVGIADFNHDFIADIAIAHGEDGTISVYAGTSGGSFYGTPFYEISTGKDISEIMPADISNDSLFDISAICGDSASFITLFNIGNDEFIEYTYSTTLNNHSGISMADVSGDGKVDVAISCSSSDSMILFISENPEPSDTFPAIKNENHLLKPGTGRHDQKQNRAGRLFDPPIFIDVNDTMVDIAAGDFNYDGLPDFLTIKNDGSKGAALTSTDSSNLNSSITVLSPNGSEDWTLGQERLIKWQKGKGITAVEIQISLDNGSIWETIVRNQPGNSYTWKVAGPESVQALMRIRDAIVPNRCDTSDAVFSISSACGDVNLDNDLDLEDVIRLANHILLSFELSTSLTSADVDCSGTVDVNDIVRLINYLYMHGNKPCDLNGDGLPDC